MVHEFGVMSTDPEPGERYDEYEPQKYGCIAVDDALVEQFGDAVLRDLPCYWHTLDRPEHGLAYCGITLIPPASLPVLLEAAEIDPLRELIRTAMAEDKFIIHYGL
ncbi:MAG: hypothetical protein IJF56_00345 [Clostridia bacterium]|nr:hypothetical protein [Clostridia bacterium]